MPLDLLLRSNLVQQELSRMNINSLSFLEKSDADAGWTVVEGSN